ncbi:hypothetical protein DT075_38285 [Bacillus licheniformis]|nr:hypothetical protein DT075_38285 [Bacillus licheniformis]
MTRLLKEGTCFWAFKRTSTEDAVFYGFVYINRDEENVKDLKRIKKDSFYWYQNVIQTNGEEL